MKTHHKMALAAGIIGIFAVLGGTTYAIVSNWPKPAAVGTETVLTRSNGDRVIKVSLQSCLDPKVYEQKSNEPSDQSLYFEVKKDAPITNNDLEQAGVDVCNNASIANGIVNLKKLVNPKALSTKGEDQIASKNMFGAEAGTIVSMTDSTITVSVQPIHGAGGAPAEDTTPIEKTYALSPSATILDYTTKTTKSNLKVGDQFYAVIKATGVDWPDYVTSNAVLNTPGVQDSRLSIVGIMTHPTVQKSQAVEALLAKYGRDKLMDMATGAGPCTSDPQGFCQNNPRSEMLSKYVNPF